MKSPAFTFQNTELCQWHQSIPSIHFKTIEGITPLSVLLKPCCLVVKALLTPGEISHSCSLLFLRPLPVQCWETGYNSNRLQALERARELPSPQSVHTLSLNPRSIRGGKKLHYWCKVSQARLRRTIGRVPPPIACSLWVRHFPIQTEALLFNMRRMTITVFFNMG